MKLVNKKILFIAPKYFGYEEQIKNILSENNKVILLYENFDQISFFYRYLYKFFPTIKERILKKYYINIINRHRDVDFIFVIRGSSLNKEIMDHIKSVVNSKCQLIMYQWDSVDNNPVALDIAPYFKSVYTFDRKDAIMYHWNYLPLFYIDSLINSNMPRDIDVLFVCGLHSQRALMLKNIRNICKENNYKYEMKLLSNRLVFFKKKYIDKDPMYIDISVNDISFKSYSLQETYDLYMRTKVVIDYTHPNQNGFTIRTIESLGCSCKLITNNKNILEASFYDSKNILLYNKQSICIPREFVNTRYTPPLIDNSSYFELRNWIRRIFEEYYE